MSVTASTMFVSPHDVSWDFEDQVVLVTGAAHGQGAAHARAFADAGAHVSICDISAEMEHVSYRLGTVVELEEVAQSVRDAGRRCASSVCDVRDPAQVRSLVAHTMAEFGRVDVAISNAGIGTNDLFTEMSLGKWAQTIDTNLSGSFYVCKYAAKPMIDAGYGRIIVTGSIASLGGLGRCSAYTASKHGVLGLIRGMAVELAPHGVTANLICPTAVDTPMNRPLLSGDASDSDWNQAATKVIGSWNLLLDGMIHERDVTEAAMWLASREASDVSGIELRVDGGCTCK